MSMRRIVTTWAVLLVAGSTLAACAEPDDGILRQISPGSTVYIDAWDQSGETGDEALVEQKPSGLWVVPVNAPFRHQQSGEFKTRVTLNSSGQFVVEDLGGVKVGKDHDDCLSEEEVYAVLTVQSPSFEPESEETDSSNDDCQRVQSEE